MDHRKFIKKAIMAVSGAAYVIALTILWPVSISMADTHALSERLTHALSAYIGPRDAVMVAASDGTPLAHINADKPLIPASILKILTALTALEILGANYQFNTDFLVDEHNNLKIKGYGDPLLISERVHTIANALAEKQRVIKHIILDDSFFKQPMSIPGRGTSSQPYDAPNGALCVNFNTVAFEQRQGQWVSAEPQTPLLPFVVPKIESTGLTAGRITFAGSSDEALQYTGHLFRFFLQQAGIETKGSILRGQVSYETDKMLWQYQSEDNLGQVVKALLEFSNNFMANQVLLVLGAHGFGAPATVQKGLSVLNSFYQKVLGISTGQIVEASGISRRNRLTARAMITILNRFEPYHMLLRHQDHQFYKTGHLKGIRTRAGYLFDGHGNRWQFAILLNTAGKTTHGIMRIIEKQLGLVVQ